ncbi:thiamine-phosphate kinase [Arthrobacter sp. MYb224]|uniref:thiamine-phosphate kinase n=1 Tax=Arthrobacter sp. MYb224 TaxID=1848600 RepID=UPI000CFDB9D1|nr:thiamine-phosphate kinase [Arthrobacter sp. MYb224]PQZ96726.1 thiamine-phosphate kinase [Arthrobacter sp. MYb224]
MTNQQTDNSPTVGDIGEQGILNEILPLLDAKDAGLGPGDDAGALRVAGGEVVVSVDTIVQDQDFRLVWPSGHEHAAYDIGWKSIAQNVSDINAMGGVPTGAVISLSMPAEVSLAWVKEFARGIAAAISSLGADRLAILGGDLSRSSEISVTTTVLGECEYGKILRTGAKPGDRLAVAGRLGAAGAGLALLEGKHEATTWSRAVLRLADAQCKPTPPLESGPRAAQSGAHAMMDISDGLVRDAGRLAKASHVSIKLDKSALEVFAHRLEPAAKLLDIDPMQWVLHGGEDFGLLACFPAGVEIPEEFSVVGEVVPLTGRRSNVFLNGKQLDYRSGFDHFG